MIAQQRYEKKLRDRVAELEAEVEKLNDEIAGYQVKDGYDKGYEHGSATAIKVLSNPARCDRYLKSLHCTLWGEPFEVISPKGRAQAAAWLAKQIAGVAGQTT